MRAMTWVRIGAISGALAVGAGAFGAHVLESRLDEKAQKTFETAARYQMYHALALVCVGLWAGGIVPRRIVGVAGWGFLVGSLLFSGSLYGLALGGPKILGMITPFGGLAFIAGWIALALGAGPVRPSG